MKKIVLSLFALVVVGNTTAQTVTESFESFTLSANSYYKDTNNVSFQTADASFQHEWVTGNFPFWSAGFSYTNKYDSTTLGYTNLYGVIPYKGYSNSNVYVVGQANGIVKLKNKYTVVQGFYYTNTTYAYKSMLLGDNFSRKFGDTTGTGSGTTIAQGAYPDYFKMIVYGYKNGSKKSDSVEIYLADFRFSNSTQDYIVKDWRYANTTSLGSVDSIEFVMRSSDFNEYGMLTPAFFGIDNFEASIENPAGLSTPNLEKWYRAYPVPASSNLNVTAPGNFEVVLRDAKGTVLQKLEASQTIALDIANLQIGLYMLQIIDEHGIHSKTIVKD